MISKIKMRLSLYVVVALFIPQGASAHVHQGINSTYSCSASQLSLEPTSQVKNYSTTAFLQFLSAPNERALFDPSTLSKELQQTGIVRGTVSTSHIVQIVADGLKKIKIETDKMINEGKIDPVAEGKIYPGSEFESKKQSEEAVTKERIEPLLAEMYKIYLKAVAEKEAKAAELKMTPEVRAFMDKAQKQINDLSKIINTTIPTLKDKIGEIISVKNTDLPLSYHDGAIVKIRFQRPGETRSITLYPTLLLNQLTGEDEYFVKGLERWASYTEGQWTMSKNLLESYGFTFAYQFSKSYYQKLTGQTNFSPSDLEAQGPLMKKAFEKSQVDLETARWVHNEASKLSSSEVLALLDLFKALRYGDLPQCQEQIYQINKKIQVMIKTPDYCRDPNWIAKKYNDPNCKRTSRSADLKSEEKAAIEALSREAAFYQDQYKVYSTAAALVLSASHGPGK